MGKQKVTVSKGGNPSLKGRTAGVTDTAGKNRGASVAEKTVIGKGDQRDSGSLDAELGACASSTYKRAVADAPDPSKRGDQALYSR